MSGPEIKHALRKTEFPNCAKEALIKIGQLICGRVPSIKHMDLALDLMAEFIFCEVDRRGNKRPAPLTPLLELQLLEVLFDNFNNNANEAANNTIFLSLFSGTTAILRLPILCKLVSIAIGVSSPRVLLSASTWMQQLGNTSGNSCKLAESLVLDYFVLVTSAADRLKVLPCTAPQFTANFLTAVAEIYFSDNKKGGLMFPADCLLETVTNWISNDSKLCMAAQQMQSALPPGAIAMEATTPFVGLFKWCILAPLYNQTSKLYSQLHLSLLNTLIDIPNVSPPRAVCSQHLSLLVGNILRYIIDVQNGNTACGNYGNKTKDFLENVNFQLALDRYAQAVQIAISVKCIYGNIDDLINQLEQIPQTKLLSIVVNNYRQNK